MTQRKLRTRQVFWGCAAVFLAALGLAFDAKSDTSTDILGSCTGSKHIIKAESEQFCVPDGTDPTVWMAARPGTSYEAMFDFCCKNSEKLVRFWTGLQRGTAQKDSWYPIHRQHLKEEVVVALFSSEMRPKDEDKPRVKPVGVTPPQVVEPIVKPPEEPPISVPTEPSIFSRAGIKRLIPPLGLILALFFSLLALYRTRTDRGARKGEWGQGAGGRGQKFIPPIGTELDKWRDFAAFFSASLVDALVPVVKAVTSQKVTVELLPPVRSTEWVTFLRTVQEDIDRLKAASSVTQEHGVMRPDRREPEFDAVVAPLPSLSIGSGTQLYAVRDTDYPPGSGNFGGRSVFKETGDQSAAFCIRVGDGGSGWLTPNLNAREYDPFYHQLFGLSRKDFLSRVSSTPQPVRREGGQWVPMPQR